MIAYIATEVATGKLLAEWWLVEQGLSVWYILR